MSYSLFFLQIYANKFVKQTIFLKKRLKDIKNATFTAICS